MYIKSAGGGVISGPQTVIFTLDNSTSTWMNNIISVVGLNQETTSEDVIVAWGDGTTTTWEGLAKGLMNGNLMDTTHLYANKGPKTITITASYSDVLNHHEAANNTLRSLDIRTWLTKVEGVFPYRTSAKNMFNGCQRLIHYDASIFNACPDLSELINTFMYNISITAIPGGLFQRNPNITTMEQVFYSNSNIETVPADLFNGLTKVESITAIFAYCSKITTLPAQLLFPLVNLKNASHMLRACTNLSSIDPNFLSRNKELIDASWFLQDITNKEDIPIELLTRNTKIENIDRFCGPARAGEILPEWWTIPHLQNASHSLAFTSPIKAANFADVPVDWRT